MSTHVTGLVDRPILLLLKARAVDEPVIAIHGPRARSVGRLHCTHSRASTALTSSTWMTRGSNAVPDYDHVVEIDGSALIVMGLLAVEVGVNRGFERRRCLEELGRRVAEYHDLHAAA